MITSSEFEKVAQSLPMLRSADAEVVQRFQQEAFYARLPAGKDIFTEGDDVEAIALLISGVVRVFKIGETGREITLYRFGLGESCILTANAILSRQSFPAIAIVEQQAEAAMIPSDSFRDWIRRYDLWRDFFFNLLSQRLAVMMSIVDEIAFRRMDARIASLLLERCQVANPILITHQEIAAELGSSREVISRILEDLSTQGLIHTSRGAIEVHDVIALQRRATV